MRRALGGNWGGAESKPSLITWENLIGVDLVASAGTLSKDKAAFARNAVFNQQYGAVSKSNGYDVLFNITPPIRGVAIGSIKNKQYMFIANNSNIYAAMGGLCVYSVSSATDWATVTCTDTVVTDGKLKLGTGKTVGNAVTASYKLGTFVYEIKFNSILNVPNGCTLVTYFSVSSDNSTWSDWVQTSADGIPDDVSGYIKFKFVLSDPAGTNTANLYADSFELYTRIEFSDPQSIYSGLSGNPVRFANYNDLMYIAYGGRPIVYNGTEVRNVGLDKPTTDMAQGAPVSPTNSNVLGPNGTYYAYYTFVNNDGVESPMSGAVSATTATYQNITWTVPVGPTGTKSRRIYRNTNAGATIYLLDEIANNTATTYTDSTNDTILMSHMTFEDDNQTPPNSNNILVHNDIMFYVASEEQRQLWYSKPGRPENVPNKTAKRFYLYMPAPITGICSQATKLFISGYGFTKFVAGTVFHSNPEISDITVRDLGRSGTLSQESLCTLTSAKGQQSIALCIETKRIFSVTPTFVEDIFVLPPISTEFDPLLRDSMSDVTVFSYRDNLFVAFSPANPQYPERVTGIYNLTLKTWQGITDVNASFYTATPWRLYAILADGNVARMLTEEDVFIWGKRWGLYWGNTPTTIGDAVVEFNLDTGYRFSTSSSRSWFRYIQLVLSGDSIPTSTTVTVVVDGVEQTISLGSKDTWNLPEAYGGSLGFGRQNSIISPMYPIDLPPGKFVGVRVTDISSNPLTIYGIVVIAEPVYPIQGGV